MSPRRGTAIAGALLALLAIVGCGLGPGSDLEPAQLTVSRDYGRELLLEREVDDLTEADTVMRVLEAQAEIETRYGGGFVQTIDGLEAARERGRAYDWLFFVDGIESPIGAAEYSLRGGERIWWDYRDWTAANRVPAVVGSWPAPFARGYQGKRYPVAVECKGGGGACAGVRGALAGAGVKLASGAPKGAIRVLVGPWARLRSDPAAAQLEGGVEASGVFADFERRADGYGLVGLDEGGRPAREFGPGAGLVAATRRYEAPPVWVVTGATAAGVAAAADLLNPSSLRDHYAVATEDGKETPLPLAGTG